MSMTQHQDGDGAPHAQGVRQMTRPEQQEQGEGKQYQDREQGMGARDMRNDNT
jgi:hypothetical protein